MKIGLLCNKKEEFALDIKQKLEAQGCNVEFISLRQQLLPMKKEFDVILDRDGFENEFLRESMKAIAMNGTYIINNPFAYTAANKIMDTMLCSELGIETPKTIFLPQIEKEWEPADSVAWPDWEEIEQQIKFPAILKSFNGYGWKNVFEISSIETAKQKFGEIKQGTPMLLQEKIDFVDYYRVFCINKKNLLIAKWKPAPENLGELLFVEPQQAANLQKKIEKQTIRLNERLDFDVNAVEWCIDKQGKAIVIDAFNEVPDMDKARMPEQYYWWMVDRTVECLRDKAEKHRKNKTFF